jgi:glycosyltransferase involved in cell wall biosynthesis
MPVYNGEPWLSDAIESILSQTYRDLELVISDNASTDRTPEIARVWAKKDDRLRVFRNPVNLGVNHNYSRLVAHARGEYFKWASSNDLCAPTFIEQCVSGLDSHLDVGLCYPRTKLFVDTAEDGTEYEDGLEALGADPIDRFKHVLRHTRLNNAINGLSRMTVLRRTSLIGPYFSSDIVLLAEIALRSRILEIPEFLFFRRFSKDSATSLQNALRVREFHFPKAGHATLFQSWRRCRGYAAAVRRSDLNLRQRLRGLAYVAKLWYWALPGLYADLREGASALSRGPSAFRR